MVAAGIPRLVVYIGALRVVEEGLFFCWDAQWGRLLMETAR